MNDTLKGFVLGFAVGAASSIVLGVTLSPLASFAAWLAGISTQELVLGLALLVGTLFGIMGAVLALLFKAVGPYGGLLISVGIIAIGVLLFQPEVDALGALGIALSFMVDYNKEGSEDEA